MLPLIEIEAGSWDAIFSSGRQARLDQALPQYLYPRRWFGAKARKISGVSIVDTITLPYEGGPASLALATVQYTEGSAETYLLPMAYAEGERARQILADAHHAVVAHLRLSQAQAEPGLLYDPLIDQAFCRALLDLIISRRRLRGERGGVLGAVTTQALRGLVGDGSGLDPSVMRGEQSNSSVNFGDRLIMKLFRKIDSGVNPDLEIGRYLTEEAGYPHTPPLAGAIEYGRPGEEPMTFALLQGYVSNKGDAFDFALAILGGYFDAALARPELEAPTTVATIGALLDADGAEPPAPYGAFVSPYLESARLLGRRTAELHLALAASAAPAFAPERFSLHYQRGLSQEMRSAAAETLQGLRRLLPGLPEDVRGDAARVAGAEQAVLGRFGQLTAAQIEAARTRVHGDYHLEQVLYTGKDYMIIDFEGEPVRPISERRIKHSPLRDVAGMLRSYQYAAYSGYFSRIGATAASPDEAARLRSWADFWAFWVSAAFLNGYLTSAAGSPIIPAARGDLERLLEVFVMEKAIYEIAYEMNNRPTWLSIPLSGILRQIGG